MIALFRKIRQKLLSQNRFTRYLAYALGEVLLVVIGILIALQINNWNTAKTIRATEIEMLDDLKIALETDLKNVINNNIRDCNIRLAVTKSIVDWSILATPPPDSIAKYHIYMGLIRTFTPVISPYKILESKGLDIIRNKTLKYKIINLYTLEYANLNTLFENETYNTRDVYRPEIRKHFKINPPEMEVRYQPLGLENSIKDRDFMNMVTIMYSNNIDLLKFFMTIQVAIQDVIREIDQEIKTN